MDKFFPTFIAKYSNPQQLLNTSDQELTDDLRFLGLYNRRCQAFKEISLRIINEYNGTVPSDEEALSALPHVGPYTLTAVLCFCFNKHRAVVDVNVERILVRVHGLNAPKNAYQKWIVELAEKMLPNSNVVEYTFGLLDIDAFYCKRSKMK